MNDTKFNFYNWVPQYNTSVTSGGSQSYGNDYFQLSRSGTGYFDSSTLEAAFYDWTGFDINVGDTIHVEYTCVFSTSGQYPGTPTFEQATNGGGRSVYKAFSNTSTKAELTLIAAVKNQPLWINYYNAGGTLSYLRFYNIWIEHTA